MRSSGFFATLLAVVLSFVACAGDEGEKSPRILAFEADPSSVRAGEPVELRWRTERAKSLRLEVPREEDHTGLPATGTLLVHPQETTTYRLVATNDSGSTAATATVSVQRQAPRIVMFQTSSESVARGQEAELRWEVQGADSLALAPEGGETIDLTASLPEGSLGVHPEETTRYELRARNDAGVTTAQLVVAVEGLPGGSFRSDPATMELGQGSRLIWELHSMESAELRQGELVLASGLEPKGSFTVQPTETTTYQLEAVGPGGSRTFETEVRVAPAIERFAAVEPGP